MFVEQKKMIILVLVLVVVLVLAGVGYRLPAPQAGRCTMRTATR